MKIYKINEYLSVNAQKYTTTRTDYHNTENLMSDGKYHPQTKEELKKNHIENY